MSEYFPVLASLLFVVVCFAFASSKGVVGLLASGVAAAIAMALILVGFEYLPKLAKDYLDIGLTWKFTLGVSAVVALVAFLFFRIVLAFLFKTLFNPDGFLHRLVDGTPGGLLSLGPSLVAVFIFFTCIRAAGTVQELSYVDSLTAENIREMGGRIPPYPLTTTWRNSIESVPYLAPLLDVTDPFSRRRARNGAALVLATKGGLLHRHLLADPATGNLAELTLWAELADDPEIAEAIAKRDRVALVTAPTLQVETAEFEKIAELEGLVLAPVIKELVKSLKPVPTPDTGDGTGLDSGSAPIQPPVSF